jgi:hypothetical protein
MVHACTRDVRQPYDCALQEGGPYDVLTANHGQSMYVCMYVCVYVCMYVCIYLPLKHTCLYVHTYGTHVFTFENTHAGTHIHFYRCTEVRIMYQVRVQLFAQRPRNGQINYVTVQIEKPGKTSTYVSVKRYKHARA